MENFCEQLGQCSHEAAYVSSYANLLRRHPFPPFYGGALALPPLHHRTFIGNPGLYSLESRICHPMDIPSEKIKKELTTSDSDGNIKKSRTPENKLSGGFTTFTIPPSNLNGSHKCCEFVVAQYSSLLERELLKETAIAIQRATSTVHRMMHRSTETFSHSLFEKFYPSVPTSDSSQENAVIETNMRKRRTKVTDTRLSPKASKYGEHHLFNDDNRSPSISSEADSAERDNPSPQLEPISMLTPLHLRKAKLMFFYTRYPSSTILKMYFPDVKFNKTNTAQLVKWFSNFREFFYIQIEKFARQCAADENITIDDLIVEKDNELYKMLNLHYNRNNQIKVPDGFQRTIEVTLKEFFQSIKTKRDAEPSWKKSIYKIVARMDEPIPDYLKNSLWVETSDT